MHERIGREARQSKNRDRPTISRLANLVSNSGQKFSQVSSKSFPSRHHHRTGKLLRRRRLAESHVRPSMMITVTTSPGSPSRISLPSNLPRRLSLLFFSHGALTTSATGIRNRQRGRRYQSFFRPVSPNGAPPKGTSGAAGTFTHEPSQRVEERSQICRRCSVSAMQGRQHRHRRPRRIFLVPFLSIPVGVFFSSSPVSQPALERKVPLLIWSLPIFSGRTCFSGPLATARLSARLSSVISGTSEMDGTLVTRTVF